MSTLCGRATVNLCRQQDSQSLTLLSVNSGREQDCFLLLQLRSLLHSRRVSVGRVNVFYTVTERFFLCYTFLTKCVLIAGSYKTYWAPCFLALSLYGASIPSQPRLLQTLISLPIYFIVTLQLFNSVAIWCLITPLPRVYDSHKVCFTCAISHTLLANHSVNPHFICFLVKAAGYCLPLGTILP